MLKHTVYQYLRDHALQFPEQARPRQELDKALLFFGGQCFAYAFLLYVLSPQMPALWPGAYLHLTLAFAAAGVISILALAKRRTNLVSKDDPVNDELLSLIFESGDVEPRVKKHIAVEIKKQGYVSYRQLLAFGELQLHRSIRQENKSAPGAAAFIKALDEGHLS